MLRIGRFWWVWALVALLQLAITLALTAASLFGLSAWPWIPASITPNTHQPDLFRSIPALMGAYTLGLYAVVERRRRRWYLRAVDGDESVLAPTRYVPAPSSTAPDLRSGPLTLLWRRAPDARLLLGCIALRRQRPTFGVIATDEGITWLPAAGREQTVRWGDARLLELRSLGPSFRYGVMAAEYVFYGTWDAVRWPAEISVRRADIVPDGISREEMDSRREALLSLIAARTGLAPRSANPLHKAWQRPSDTQAQLARLRRYVRDVPSALEPYALPPEPPPPSATGRYVLHSKPSRIPRLSRRFSILLLGVFGVFGASLLFTLLGLMVTLLRFVVRAHSTPAAAPAVVAFVALLVLLCIGLPLGVAALAAKMRRYRRIRIVADGEGLSMRTMGFTSFAAWDEIAKLTVRLCDGQPEQYAVGCPAGRYPITWRRQHTRVRRVPAGMTPITPEQLAALVVARTGVPVVAHRAGQQ